MSGSGTGDLSAVIAGIDFAVNNHRQTGRKSVANLSLGATFNSVLNSAVNAAVDSGLPMIVTAGNSNSAACASSPASEAKAITVGAIDDRYDTIASFSNWGSCVDLFASGVYVASLSHNGKGAIALSGTSMASPQVAGIMSILMGQGDSVEEASAKVTEIATANAIGRRSILFRPRTPNLIAYNGHQQWDAEDGENSGIENGLEEELDVKHYNDQEYEDRDEDELRLRIERKLKKLVKASKLRNESKSY